MSNYFEWLNRIEKNNCMIGGVLQGGKRGEMSKGQPLAAGRTEPYTCTMDAEYRKNVRLTDSLYNDQDSIIASPRLRDFLLERLGKKIETLPLWIKDHRGRVATKDYVFINILDVQDCLAVKESEPSYATLRGKQVMINVEQTVLTAKKVGKDARLFRLAPLTRIMIVREDLMEELVAAKFEGMGFEPVEVV